MFSENNRISGRQMYRLMTYDLLGIGTLLVPQMLAKTAGRDGILSIGIGMAAALAYGYCAGLRRPHRNLIRNIWSGSWEGSGEESYRPVI